jgi:hypothetical protein
LDELSPIAGLVRSQQHQNMSWQSDDIALDIANADAWLTRLLDLVLSSEQRVAKATFLLKTLDIDLLLEWTKMLAEKLKSYMYQCLSPYRFLAKLAECAILDSPTATALASRLTFDKVHEILLPDIINDVGLLLSSIIAVTPVNFAQSWIDALVRNPLTLKTFVDAVSPTNIETVRFFANLMQETSYNELAQMGVIHFNLLTKLVQILTSVTVMPRDIKLTLGLCFTIVIEMDEDDLSDNKINESGYFCVLEELKGHSNDEVSAFAMELHD